MRYWILLLLLLGPTLGLAEGSVDLRWETRKPIVGEPVDLVVSGDGLENVFGMQMDLSFDGYAVTVDDPVHPGTFWPEENRMELRNKVNDEGIVQWAFSLLRPAKPLSGDGVLARITLNPKRATQLSVSAPVFKFGTPEGDVIEPEVELPDKPFSIYASRADIPARTSAAVWAWVGAGVVLVVSAIAVVWQRRRKAL